MPETIISFRGVDAGVSDIMQKLRQDSLEYGREMVSEAQSRAQSSKEVIDYLNKEIGALERKNQLNKEIREADLKAQRREELGGVRGDTEAHFFSKGAEHGHVHGHDKITQMPWLLFISLCVHALLEGFPVGRHHDLAYGIAIHHLPIAIILTTFFLNAQLNKAALFIFMVTFAVMTPLGTLVSDSFPILNQYYTQITAVVIGILFHISSTIIFESSEGHKFNIAKVSMIILGIVLASFL